jgi:hypothetical protein
MIEIPVVFTGKGELPEHATPLSAGMDLTSSHIEATHHLEIDNGAQNHSDRPVPCAAGGL